MTDQLSNRPQSASQPPAGRLFRTAVGVWRHKSAVVAALAIAGIVAHLVLRYGLGMPPETYRIPLLATLILGGLPMLYDLLRKLLKLQFGSDLLGGISIITSVLLGEYLAGSIIVLMLAGGEALESYALRSASSVLAVLQNLLQRQPVHPRLPKNLPPAHPIHQNPSTNLAPLFHIAIHASWLMKMPHFWTASSHT